MSYAKDTIITGMVSDIAKKSSYSYSSRWLELGWTTKKLKGFLRQYYKKL